MSRQIVVSSLMVLGVVLLTPAQSHAEVFRGTFVIDKPTTFTGALAVNRAVDAVAAEELAEQFIRERLSGVLVRRREAQVRTALEPLTNLMQQFKVVRRTDVAGNKQQVVCEADVDTIDVVLRLLDGNVLSFGQFSPRLMLWPGNAVPEAVQALRGRISEAVRSTGVTLLATEAAAPRAVQSAPAGGRGRRPGTDPVAGRDAMLNAAIDAGANFVALIDITTTPTVVPGVGVAVDVNIHYTLMRPSDAAILGERTISARGGGASAEVALQRVLADKASDVAKGLAGELVTTIFKNGRAIDPELPTRPVTINVAERPNASATSALMDLLRDRGFTASLGTGRVAAVAGVAIEDRVLVDGRGVTVEEVFDVLANNRFGRGDALVASVFAHGTDSLDVELVDVTVRPKREPIIVIVAGAETTEKTTTIAGGASISGSIATTTSKGAPEQGSGRPAGAPVAPQPNPLPIVEARGRGTVAGGTRALEFEFSEAFQLATRPVATPAR